MTLATDTSPTIRPFNEISVPTPTEKGQLSPGTPDRRSTAVITALFLAALAVFAVAVANGPAAHPTHHEPTKVRDASHLQSTTVDSTVAGPIIEEPASFAEAGNTSADERDLVSSTTTTFCAIGDAPYTSTQAKQLKSQLKNKIPSDCEFVIHIGDIRYGGGSNACTLSEFQAVAAILKFSPKTVFMVKGDNEYNDCSNINSATTYWQQVFGYFEQHWSSSFSVTRPSSRPENFSFTNRGALIIGLNIVGSPVQSTSEWKDRLSSEFTWTRTLIRDYRNAISGTGRVVIFGHANPNSDHDEFFIPLQAFIQDELKNSIPILYLHGDGHFWKDQTNFYGQSSFRSIMLTGGTSELPLKVFVKATGLPASVDAAFSYDRRLGQ
jgi:predicted phosphodiesterase